MKRTSVLPDIQFYTRLERITLPYHLLHYACTAKARPLPLSFLIFGHSLTTACLNPIQSPALHDCCPPKVIHRLLFTTRIYIQHQTTHTSMPPSLFLLPIPIPIPILPPPSQNAPPPISNKISQRTPIPPPIIPPPRTRTRTCRTLLLLQIHMQDRFPRPPFRFPIIVLVRRCVRYSQPPTAGIPRLRLWLWVWV